MVEHTDLAAERAVIGAVLADQTLVWQLVEVVDTADFSSPAHRAIWDAIVRLDGKQQRIDHLSLATELKLCGLLEAVGGPAYLMGIDLQVPFAHSAVEYARIVRSHAKRRGIQTSEADRMLRWIDESTRRASQAVDRLFAPDKKRFLN